ncbi:MAG: hypothetical protein ABFC67_14725 [Mizugakiibacter sp.]|uniref:hypothetical protein n=1 Tax=Mizugakiibacter sp. TaxID=1972610 RepID=UPI00320EB2B1
MSRSIIDTLRHIAGGVFIDEASDALAEVVRAVDATGKAGSVTLKIDIRRATAGAMAVRGTCSVKKPSEPAIEALLFPTPDGNLLTEDPNQKKLDLRPVGVEKVEIKPVEATA